ncbi:hypothetical protein LIER_11018 [Lithospermum erythrorhizon]|uniref:Uncharacterized protein n=1 Tax=Lithospermum erythrorhizon TaxID=34254 RepID=A0AAV3PLG9_LITER
MSTRGETQKEKNNSLKERENLKKPIPHEEIVKVPFAKEKPEKTFRIGTMLEENHRENLIRLIKEDKDIFAWGPEDMPGIDTSFRWHKLHVDSMYVPIKKKKQTFNDEKNQAIRTKVDFLLKEDAISEF